MNIEASMEASSLYKCIADPQRLRILNLLAEGPLCVCHLQDLLKESQVKISKQLNFLKRYGLLKSTREGNWMVYSLTAPDKGLLQANLDYLNEANCNECNQLKRDRAARAKLIHRISAKGKAPEQVCGIADCC
ncbi:MAG: ArsR/SmtB family transcription factor [Opitutales bacterium]|jgi:ArsR family transcriptional regulator